MKTASFALVATLMAGTAFAQVAAPTQPTPGNTAPGATSVAPMNGVSPNTGVTPSTSVTGRNSGVAAASGDRNQAVATTSANAPQPAKGRNSFTQGEARRRLERNGFQQVNGLHKDNMGVWRGTAIRDGASVPVWLDYKGNMSPGGVTPAASSSAVPGATMGTTTGSTMGTTGATTGTNPPGTAASRATDRALGTNSTGTNPANRNVDGTTGNPPGTAATRAMDRALGTNSTGTNPAGANTTTGTPARP